MTKQVAPQISKPIIDEEGRYIIFNIKENDEEITIVALYAPNEDKPIFFRNIREKIREKSEHKILVGDFNMTLDINLDRSNTYCNNNKAKKEVEDICDEFSMKDVWRIQNGDHREYSWYKTGNIQKASRIDYALVTGGLDQKVKTTQYLTGIKTDHRAFYMVVDTNLNERGKGFWKLNTSLLKEKEYVETINKEIEKTKVLCEGKPAKTKWEILKKRIKKATVDYSRKKGAEDKYIIAQLSEAVCEYESRLPLNKEEDKILLDTKTDLEEKLLQRVKGIMFRNKIKWYEEGEKNTRYFFSLEKARYNAKTCFKLINDQNEEITNQEKILDQQRIFYQDLYQEDKEVKFTMKNSFGIRVPEEIKKEQENQITMKDLEEAIKGMNNGKTPGEDGIPVDFYKVFWLQLKEAFYQMMIQGYEEDILHDTARRGILNLIPKPNKDTRYIKNLRPITLLNTDYKIIEKSIANKMLPALQHIIHTDQRGFMKDRRISVNIRKMLDIMHQAEKEDLEAVIMSLDFVKCFDKCSFSILHGSLEFFEFAETVKKWTKILYDSFSVKIQNNGHFSSEIPINKGVHQGGCCSSIYFLVIAEILALSLRANEEIEGITIHDIRQLLNQFADDMDIFSINKEQSIRGILQELNNFKQQSGFTVSYEKTTLYRIGSLRHSNATLYSMNEFVWSKEDINVLGITIAHEDITQKNYSQLPSKIKSILNAWYNRGLSLIGKIQVVNTLIASLFVYKMMVLPTIPKNIVKAVDNIIRDFIWSGRKSKIAYSILKLPKNQGGLNLVDLRKKDISLKATWPQILQKEHEYAQLVYQAMRCKDLGNDIWRCTLLPEDIKKLKFNNEFWKDVLIAWNEFNFSHEFKVENQLVWYNSHIRIGNKPVLWSDMLRRGLKYVHQLFSTNGFKSEEEVKEEFGMSILRYNSLKAAIPNRWKEYFSQNNASIFNPLPPHNYDKCLTTYRNNLTKKIYRWIAEDATIMINKFQKWTHTLGEEFCTDIYQFAKLHQDIYSLTNVTKYRSFQYRLLQRGIVTNIHMFEWKMIKDDKCTFCKECRETIEHLFVECEKVRELWQKLRKYIRDKYMVEINVNHVNIITNKLVDKKDHVINFICLITKQFIYRQRCAKNTPDFPVLKALIAKVENIEKYIAKKNGKEHIHNKKWRTYGEPTQGPTMANQSTAHYVQQYITENM